MPHDLVLKTMNTVHQAILTLSGGRIGSKIAGMPVLELTTIGRKSGEPRTVLLTSPIQFGGQPVVVASRGGDDRNPAWFFNLQSNPEVEVAIEGGAKKPMRARVATDAERDDLWPQIASKYSNYAGYQSKTSRVIPLVILEEAT